MPPTITTILAYCLAVPDALAERLFPALKVSFEYLLFLMNKAAALPEIATETTDAPALAVVEDAPTLSTPVKAPVTDITPIPTLALVEDGSAIDTPVKAPATKSTRKTSKPKGFTANTTKRRGKRATVVAAAAE